MLPTNSCPLLCIIIGDSGKDILGEFEVIKFDTGTIELGKFLPVCQFGLPPEEFYSIEVWPVRGVPDKRDLLLEKPFLDPLIVMDRCIVHKDAPFVSRR